MTRVFNVSLSSMTKGLPGEAAAVSLDDVGQQGWNVLREDLPFPVAVIRQDALEHNLKWMNQFLTSRGVRLAPHGKTTMCPKLFKMQMDQGAWGITVATTQQLNVCYEHGIGPVLMANQLVGKAAVRNVAEKIANDPAFEFYCLVDSKAQLDSLQHQLAEMEQSCQRPIALRVLIELGFTGGRTGCRNLQQVVALAEYIQTLPNIALHGLECYEGGFVSKDISKDVKNVEGLLSELATAYHAIKERQGFVDPSNVLLTAGGSAYFDLVADALHAIDPNNTVCIVRSGCYLTHDSKFYRQLVENLMLRCQAGEATTEIEGLRPALEVWTCVQSVPEPGLAILSLGKRDISHDIHLPIAHQWFRPDESNMPITLGDDFEIVALNDQHAYLLLPDNADVAVGDIIGLGISHPCTTFDKWQLIHLVNQHYDVVDGLKTYF